MAYSEQLGIIVCDRIADGESLRRIARTEGMPKPATVIDWVRQYPAFAEQYARARELQADVFFDEISEIAHDGSKDWVMTKFGPEFDGEHVQRSRLRVDSLKWQASKLAPKKYGDKMGIEHSGSVATTLSDEELNARIAALASAKD